MIAGLTKERRIFKQDHSLFPRHAPLSESERETRFFMKKNHFLRRKAKCLACIFCLLAALAFAPLGPKSGWASPQGQSRVFTAHVASFRNPANADQYARRLADKGLKTWTATRAIPGKESYYRVYLGYFSSREAALQALQKLKSEKVISYFALEESNPPSQAKAEPQSRNATGKSLPSRPAVRGENPAVPTKAPPQPEKGNPEELRKLQRALILQPTGEPPSPKAPPPAKPPESAVGKVRGPVAGAADPDREEKQSTQRAQKEERPANSGQDASFYYHQGISHLRAEQFDAAHLSFSNAIRLDGHFTEGYVKRGDVLYLKGDYEMAINDYNTAIALKPTGAESYFGRGLAYHNLGQIKKAAEDLRYACKLGSREACALLNVWPKPSPFE